MGSLKDWMLSLRALRRRPAYALLTVAVLGLGVGATATLFSVVDTVLLQPLPYPNADRLVLVLEANPSRHDNADLVAPGRLRDWNRMNGAFAAGTGLAGEYAETETDTSGAAPERLAGERVSPGFFGVLGMPPRLGRTFTADEDKPVVGPGPVVISYGFWTRRYGRDPGVLGKRLVLGGTQDTIVGVMPRDFFNAATDVFLPARLPNFLLTDRTARFYNGIGRLRPGVTAAQGQADLARVEAVLGQQYPATDKGWSAQVTPLKDFLVGKSSLTLWALLAAVLVLLLLAVANIAGLTLAQMQGRSREMAIRSALGASRGQVMAAVLRESGWLALGGALAGGGVAWAGVRAAAALAPGTLPRMSELAFDWRGWAFAVGISGLAALGFGLGPALAATSMEDGLGRPKAALSPLTAVFRRAARPGLSQLLVSVNAGGPGGKRRLQRVLVASQLALTVLLVASAGLLLRSYYNLSHQPGGFDADHVVTFRVSASWNEVRDKVSAMQERLLAGLGRLPGVTSVGFTNFLPASNASLQYQYKFEGLPGVTAQGTYPLGERSVTPGYLKTLGVPLEAGAWCPEPGGITNNRAGLKAMVNEAFVRRYAAGQNMVGRNFHFAQDPPGSLPEQVTGIVGDVRENSLATPATPFVYICQPYGGWPDPEYVVRSAGSPTALMAAIPKVVAEEAPGRAVFGMARLGEVIDTGLQQPKLDAQFLALFAGFALLLAAVGLYSLISLLVAARQREMGLRIALGARRGQVAGLVLGSMGKLLAWGAVAGLALTWAADRLVASLLYGVTPLDAGTLLATLGVLGAVALLAAWLPARRAAATDPLLALRAE